MKRIRKLLPFIGILLLIYLIFKIGVKKILTSIVSIKPIYLIFAIIFTAVILIPPAIKWGLILRAQGFKLKLLDLMRLNLIGLFYGVVTPGRVGNLLKIVYLKDKIKKPIGACSSSVILDKSFDLIVILGLAAIGALLLLNIIANLWLPVLIGFVILVSAVIFFTSKKRSRFILRLVYKFLIPKKFKSVARDSFHSFYDSLPKLRYLVIPFLLTVVSYFLFYTVTYIVALSLSINTPYFYFIPLLSLATVVGLLPITIVGLGTREMTLVILFNLLFGIKDADKIVAMSLIALIISTILPSLIGWYFSLKHET